MKPKIFFLLITLSTVTFSQTQKPMDSRAAVSDFYLRFTPNNLSFWFGSNGDMGYDPYRGNSGGEWIAGSKKFFCYEAGVVFGGMKNGKLHVGGSTYRHGLQAGEIMPSGKPADRNDSTYRIYHIKRADAKPPHSKDYIDWKTRSGALLDSTGEPRFFGDEQIWFVSNDLDTSRTKNLYGTNPIGLEIQTLAWGNAAPSQFKDVIFVQQLIINKSDADLKDAYICLWADFDLGDANDDFVGIDTSLQLSYCFNASANDPVYGTPPACGFLFLRTPTISSSKDTVMSNGMLRAGKKYSPLSGYTFYEGASAVYKDPEMGVESGAREFYENFKGIIWNGGPFIDPTSGHQTRFCLAGDPVTKRGWVDGIVASGGDRRSVICAGPFQIAARDTQEFTYAILVARDVERLTSITKLRNLSRKILTFFPDDFHFEEYVKPKTYELYLRQNFPNPFGDGSPSSIASTLIRYSIPLETTAAVRIRNVFGHIVETLADKVHPPGEYSVSWAAPSLPSGLYLVELQALGVTIQRKMMVVK